MGQTNRQTENKLRIKALCALVFSLWVIPASALDLGRLQIFSAIGEPLRAEVDIAQATAEQLSTLQTQLASPNSFNQAGMEYNPALVGMTATLQTRSNGARFIALNGQLPVRENFIDLILETKWATGRLVKNYALLLNSVNDKAVVSGSSDTFTPPPKLAPLPSAASSVPSTVPVIRATQTEPLPEGLNPTSVTVNEKNIPVYRFAPTDNSVPAASAKLAALETPAISARPETSSVSRSVNETSLQVKTGDTASRLALRHMASNVSLDQMLLAMLEANPDAFIQGNVNLVKAGAVIRIPTTSEALKIPRAQARKMVLSQARDFAAYAQRLAQSALLVDRKTSREMSGKVGTEATQETTANPLQDKLTLSKSDIKNNNAEAKLAAEKEAKDTATQLAELNKNLQDLEALSKNQPLLVASSSTAPSAATSETTPIQDDTGYAALLKELKDNKQIWTWAAALLAFILLFVFWVRRKSSEPQTVYAPSYDDIAPHSTNPAMKMPMGNTGMPTDIASLDLNLQPPPPAADPAPAYMHTHVSPTPVSQAAKSTVSTADDTEQRKLHLAAQLSDKGDKDLARALILSVISSSSGDLKAKAIQQLGQIR
jgi:pilus assembly protein FimV